MILASPGSQHDEVNRRVANCRERLRRARATHKMTGRAMPAESAEDLPETEVHEVVVAGERHGARYEETISARGKT
ncbi:MAG: hypothetical protein M3Q76_00795 [Acidobacteriota bacterium]|nr:hypothetical protein [Acidobacteriota bacterium]